MKIIKSVAVVIHSFNEEKNIKVCIESAKLLTSNIILIDMESTDRTTTIASEIGAEIHIFPNSHYVEPSREFGVSKAQAEWILIIDADERITANLASEIKSAIKTFEFRSEFTLRRTLTRVWSLKSSG